MHSRIACALRGTAAVATPPPPLVCRCQAEQRAAAEAAEAVCLAGELRTAADNRAFAESTLQSQVCAFLEKEGHQRLVAVFIS